MGRWSKRPEEDQPSIEQFELRIEEEVAVWARRRRQGENIDAIPTRPRKLSPIEVRYLEMKAEQRARIRDLEESGW
jgi:hypothetical protein